MPANNWGLIPDIRDPRDHKLEEVMQLPTARVPRGSNRVLQYIKNQSKWGSCTGFGTTRVIRYAMKKLGFSDVDLSELMAYFNARIAMGTTGIDSGASIRGSLDAARKYGVCRQDLWDYKNADGYIYVEPNKQAYDNALQYQILEYMAVQNNPDAINAALAAGFAITFGTTVWRNAFENAPLGVIRMPQSNDTISGAHNVVLDEWDDNTGMYGGPNSWGMWGAAGYFTMVYDYVTHFGFDLWAVRLVEGDMPPPQPSQRVVDAVGAHLRSGSVVHLWPTAMTNDDVDGLGVHYRSGETQQVYPVLGPIQPPGVRMFPDREVEDTRTNRIQSWAINEAGMSPDTAGAGDGQELSHDAPGKGTDD